MKRLIGVILALTLLSGGFVNVAAQQAQTPVVAGIDETITWVGEDGSPIATVQVTDVNTNFTDYLPEQAPDFGYRYQTISFSVENVSDESIIIEPRMFTTVTDHGEMARDTLVDSASESFEQFVDGIPLGAGESAELTTAYLTPDFSTLALFRWSPDSERTLHVYLSPELGESSAIAHGTHAPAVFFDDFGNPVASVEVTGINTDWTAYSDFSEPDEGESWVAVHMTATNLTDRTVMVRNQHIRIVTETGQQQRPAYVSVDDDTQEPLSGEAYIEPGESIDFYIVFESTPDTEVFAVQWSPSWSDFMFVMLTETGSATPATPEATPAN